MCPLVSGHCTRIPSSGRLHEVARVRIPSFLRLKSVLLSVPLVVDHSCVSGHTGWLLLLNTLFRLQRKVELQRQKIQADFKDLHSFLQEEEKSYLWKLEQEKEQMLKVLSDNEASLVHTTSELESHIQDLEDRCQGSAQKLLQVRLGTGRKGKRGLSLSVEGSVVRQHERPASPPALLTVAHRWGI